MEENDDLLSERLEELNGLVTVFCRLHFNEAYEFACLLQVTELGTHPDEPLAQGDLKLWAAGIVHRSRTELGNYSEEGKPFASDKVIASHFGVKPLAIRGKSEQIATLLAEAGDEDELDFPFDDWDEDWDEDDIYPLDYEIQEGEFIDIPRDQDELYINIGLEMFDELLAPANRKEVVAHLIAFTKREPDFLFPYLDLADSEHVPEDEQDSYLQEAYSRALRLIGAESGTWPRILEANRVENRHILFTFLEQAKRWWKLGKTDEAKQLLRKMLEVDPLDDANARYILAAILEGLTFEQWQELTDESDLSEDEQQDIIVGSQPSPADLLFESLEVKHPEEFEPWRQRRAARREELELDDEDEDDE